MKLKSANYIAQLPRGEAEKELQRITRAVYSTPEGAIVLSALLQDLCWNDEAQTLEQHALKNFATFYLKDRLGLKMGHSATVALLNQGSD